MSYHSCEEEPPHSKIKNIDLEDLRAKTASSSAEHTSHVTIDQRGDLTLRTSSSTSNPARHAKSFLVCSRALSRVSSVLERMLYGHFGESLASATDQWIVNLPEDDPTALEQFLNLAHGNTQKVPFELSIDELFSLTKLTQYYDATPLLKPWISQWMASLREPRAENEIRMYKMLWIHLELGQRRSFGLTARRIVMESAGLYSAENLISELEVFPDLIGELHTTI